MTDFLEQENEFNKLFIFRLYHAKKCIYLGVFPEKY